MKAQGFILGLAILGASGCASSAALSGLEIRQPETRRSGPGVPPSARLDANPGSTADLDTVPPAQKRPYHELERQLHLIADQQLDVTRDEVQELFAELHARRMLSQAAINAAARQLEDLREASNAKRAESTLRPLPGVSAVSEDARGTVITLSCEGLFDPKSSVLSTEANSRLGEIARALTKLAPAGPILVEAHADSTLPAASLELSHRRALAVRAYLAQEGIDAGRITALGRAPNGAVRASSKPSLEIVFGSPPAGREGTAQP